MTETPGVPEGVTITPPPFVVPSSKSRKLLRRGRRIGYLPPDKRWMRNARLVVPDELQRRVPPTKRTNG